MGPDQIAQITRCSEERSGPFEIDADIGRARTLPTEVYRTPVHFDR